MGVPGGIALTTEQAAVDVRAASSAARSSLFVSAENHCVLPGYFASLRFRVVGVLVLQNHSKGDGGWATATGLKSRAITKQGSG